MNYLAHETVEMSALNVLTSDLQFDEGLHGMAPILLSTALKYGKEHESFIQQSPSTLLRQMGTGKFITYRKSVSLPLSLPNSKT